MKLVPSTLFLILATSIAAHADILIEQKMESTMLNGNMVMKIKGDQARIDMPGGPMGEMSMIVNTKTGDMITLIHSQKMMMKMNMNAMRAQTEAAQKAAGIDPAKMEKPKATGATEKVGTWTADVYDFNAGGMTGKLWAAKDFPNAQAIKDEMKKLSALNKGSFDPNKMDVPGMVVKSTANTPAGPITSTLTKVSQDPLPDADFQAPTGYNEMKMPTLPAAPAQ